MDGWVGLLDVPGQGGVARRTEDACYFIAPIIPSRENIFAIFCEVLTCHHNAEWLQIVSDL